MLFRIAWRNVWRNRRRSLIVLVSIIVGVVAVMVYDGVSVGMIRQMLDNQIGSHVSHIQIHAKGFNDNRIVQNNISRTDLVETALDQTAGIAHWSKRVITFGLLSSALNSSGGLIVGVDPRRESEVTSIKSSLLAGRYLSGKKGEVIIGSRLADRLQVEIGDKVVGMASTVHGDVGSDLFRVVGIYQTVSSDFDKIHMFTSLENAREMLELDGKVLEYALVLDDIQSVDGVARELRRRLGGEFEVHTYIDLLPLTVAQVEMYNQSMYYIYLIIGLAMIFGIVNTMLMSVFERIQEFGVLMAIGMKNGYVFRMVMAEASILAIIGTGLGLALGSVLLILLNYTGIDFGIFTEGLASYGVGAVIYPALAIESVISVIVIIPLTSLLGALYPAVKATRLQPVKAIRFV